MADERFLQRWSRLKTQGAPLPADAVAPVAAAEDKAVALPAPTLDDVAALTSESDYSVFLGDGVDTAVRRLAMKKLFADPHFNVVDGLDIYMGDYSKPDPVSPAMLAALQHARSVMEDVFADEEGGRVGTDEEEHHDRA